MFEQLWSLREHPERVKNVNILMLNRGEWKKK